MTGLPPSTVLSFAHIFQEWASGDPGAVITWDYATASGVAYHTFARQTQSEFAEVNQQASWGNWYWSTASGDSVSQINIRPK